MPRRHRSFHIHPYGLQQLSKRASCVSVDPSASQPSPLRPFATHCSSESQSQKRQDVISLSKYKGRASCGKERILPGYGGLTRALSYFAWVSKKYPICLRWLTIAGSFLQIPVHTCSSPYVPLYLGVLQRFWTHNSCKDVQSTYFQTYSPMLEVSDPFFLVW